MRSIPERPAEDLDTNRPPAQGLEVEVCLITRLYGGGNRVGQIDERSWIRPSAFKSALRFWWRAGHAHLFTSLAELHQHEARLFGSPARFTKGKQIEGGPGLIEAQVENALPSNLEVAAFQPRDNEELQGNALNLAYFPAALDDKADATQMLALPAGTKKSTHAKLIIRWEKGAKADDIEQVKNALRLFLVLGGVGARSRRGAGALAVTQEANARELGVPTTPAELDAFLKKFFRVDQVLLFTNIWHLAAAKMIWRGRKSSDTGEASQIQLLELLREVRQDRPHPPDWKGGKAWGRSRWPEADAIRIHAQPYHRMSPNWRHQPKLENAGKYPRAALGLPIVVKFKDDFPGQDPPKHAISAALPGPQQTKLRRFASPLILRPVRIWEHGLARYLPVAVLGPLTLPKETIALVELESKQQKELQTSDLVAGYRIVENAEEKVFGRVIEQFSKNLQKLT